MPIYSYRCRACGGVTDAYASVHDAPATVRCEHCDADDTYKVIGRVAYHANEATKTSRLDPKYEKRVDDAMRKSSNADPNRLLRKMRPLSDAKD